MFLFLVGLGMGYGTIALVMEGRKLWDVKRYGVALSFFIAGLLCFSLFIFQYLIITKQV